MIEYIGKSFYCFEKGKKRQWGKIIDIKNSDAVYVHRPFNPIGYKLDPNMSVETVFKP